MADDRLIIGGYEFKSRLFVGTGKYKDFAETKKAIEASGADVVTVAVRRVNITDRSKENLLDYLDPKKYTILPNTAGCYNVEDALRYARLARAAGVSDLIKLEVLGDERTLFPDTAGLIEAAKILVKEGFIVLPYTNDDPIVAQKLVDVGCPAVMPLAAPIGSGLGIRNPYNLKIMMEMIKVPIVVDAGVGTASDAAFAMELGADAVLMNTAIAGAKDPIAMAEAMKYGVLAGRLAYKAGRIPRKLYATASSPIEQFFIKGLVDDENLFYISEIGDKEGLPDGDRGDRSTGFKKSLEPGECNVSYISGLTTDRDYIEQPLVFAKVSGEDGNIYVLVVRIDGTSKSYKTRDGIAREKRDGKDVDIFSKEAGFDGGIVRPAKKVK